MVNQTPRTALTELLTWRKEAQFSSGIGPPSLSGQIPMKTYKNFPNMNKPTKMFAILKAVISTLAI